MTSRRLTLAALLVVIFAPSAFTRGVLQYTVNLRDTKSHLVHVTLAPAAFSRKTATFQMPVWAPGAYSVTHYGKYVVNFKVFDKAGHSLESKQINDDRWEIASGKSVAKIEYDVLDSHMDTTSLYFAMANMDTSLFFANATALFGYYNDDKTARAQVEYLLPSDWKLACALASTKGYTQDTNATFTNTTFVAKDYDELADAPVMAAPRDAGEHSNRLSTRSFKEGSAIYDVAVATSGTWSEAKMDSLSFYLQKIVHAETDFFHDTPFQHYTFVIYAPTLSHLPSFAEGALEHANSSDYLLMDFAWPSFKGAFLSIFSHEFFHLWNVKRIHSALLGPFDYTKRVMTTSLWMAEGVTEYYAHTLLARYGIIDPARFFVDVDQWRKEMEMAPATAKVKTLEELSIDESTFDMDEATLFYSRGPLVAMMLDIEIRNRTHNKKSLDDVMLALNKDARLHKTFREDDLIHKVEHYAGIDLTDFYNRYIHGWDSLPIDRYLAMMGVSPGKKSGNASSLGFTNDGKFVVHDIDTSSALARAGIGAGDLLIAVNGTKLSPDNIDLLSSLKDSLPSATVTIERNGQYMDVPVTFTKSENAATQHAGPMEIDLAVPPLATAIRKGIVGD